MPNSSTQLVGLHVRVTTSKAGIIKPNPRYALTIFVLSIPTLRRASDAFQSPEWKQAMQCKIDALKSNRTWDLDNQAPSNNVIDSLWVFKVKLGLEGSVDKLKAQLVANGAHQVKDVDYFEEFSPTIKVLSISLVLKIVITKRWRISKLDIGNVS